MSNTRYSSKEFLVESVELYRQHRSLWKIKSKEYANKNLKNEAYDVLINLCKTVDSNANRDFGSKKVQLIRGSFRKEMKKVEQPRRSGSSTEVFYVPSLGTMTS
jgi:hypothetical protein